MSQLADVPRKDLPDLMSFFQGMLVYNKRRPERDDGEFSFRTPEVWQQNAPGVRARYEGLFFRRAVADAEEAKRIVGVGHQAFDRALAQAAELEPCLTLIPAERGALGLFRVQDAVTTDTRQVRQVLVGVTADGDDGLRLLRDEECLELLNQYRPGQADPVGPLGNGDGTAARAWLGHARALLQANLAELRLPFRTPLVEDLALLWPAAA